MRGRVGRRRQCAVGGTVVEGGRWEWPGVVVVVARADWMAKPALGRLGL